MWGQRNSRSLLVKTENGAATLKDIVAVFTTLNTLHDPAITLLGVHPKCPHKPRTQVFTAALFIGAKLGSNQDALPQVNGEHMGCVHSTECHSAQKRSELPSRGKTWRNFESVLLSVRKQRGKVTYCTIPTL